MSQEQYEQQKQERARQKDSARRAQRRTRHKQIFGWSIGIVLVVVVFGVLVYLLADQVDPDRLAGEHHPEQNRAHIQPGTPPPGEYSTNPPTSGWHYPSTLRAGFYETPQSFGLILHSLEHGAVAIYYSSDISDEELAGLREIYERNSNKKLIFAPYDDMETRFALTAWRWLDTFDEFDEERIERFIDDHHDTPDAPERGASI